VPQYQSLGVLRDDGILCELFVKVSSIWIGSVSYRETFESDFVSSGGEPGLLRSTSIAALKVCTWKFHEMQYVM
jgi:hypothetical protein